MAKNIFVAKSADIVGNVSMGDSSSVWYQAVVRGDQAPVSIGSHSNVQDGSVVHVDLNHPTNIGDGVTIGHNCTIHGCTVGDNTLVGMGSIILNGARIGRNSIVGAGSLVTENKSFPDGKLILGSPAKVVRDLTAEEIKSIHENAEEYEHLMKLEAGKTVYEDQNGQIRVRS
ncbi:MAG: gamma carbonic anhydrase family protein [Eubacteriaceae bacterium]|jgi:carbonic anhydrase/acetyltransferase-like protein (isoleucine patch superfamily)